MALTQCRFLGDREIPADASDGVQTLCSVENFPRTGSRLHQGLLCAWAS